MEDLHIKEHFKSSVGVENTKPSDKGVVLHERRERSRGVLNPPWEVPG